MKSPDTSAKILSHEIFLLLQTALWISSFQRKSPNLLFWVPFSSSKKSKKNLTSFSCIRNSACSSRKVLLFPRPVLGVIYWMRKSSNQLIKLKAATPSNINPNQKWKILSTSVCPYEISRQFKHLPKTLASVSPASILDFLTEKQQVREKEIMSATAYHILQSVRNISKYSSVWVRTLWGNLYQWAHT